MAQAVMNAGVETGYTQGEAKRVARLDTILLALSLAVYLIVRLYRIADYPIYFFTDEAVQTVLAQDFLRDGLRGYDHVFLPTFFYNSYQYNLGFSVYWQAPALWALGKSVTVTRGASAVLTLLAAIGAGLAMRQVFRLRGGWAAVLFLSITPAWFLHSRTAFETAEAVSFYALFLYFYLRYLNGRPKALYAAALAGALTFYTYNPGRMVVAVTALFFALSDLRTHWRNRRVIAITLGLVVLLALPFLRFQIEHPGETVAHLRTLGSYWIKNDPLPTRLTHYGREYLAAFDPRYWILPDRDISRHVMDGFGHLLWPVIPFTFVGLGLALVRFRQPAYRALLLALLAGPSGAALVQLGITRVLFMVVPLALFTAIGFSTALGAAARRFRRPAAVYFTAFILLAAANGWLLSAALIEGPRWHSNYGLHGMQYGARQVFSTVAEELAKNPGLRIEVSSAWANGADIVARFFFNDPIPFEIGTIRGYLDEQRPELEETLFVMTPEEYDVARNSGKFRRVRVEQTLACPDGSPCFYFARLHYVENIGEILAAEKADRLVLREARVFAAGQPALVKYACLDIGEIENAFDGDEQTLIRTMEANPLRMQVYWDAPRVVSALSVRVGGVPTAITSTFYDEDGRVAARIETNLGEDPDPRTVELRLPAATKVQRMDLEIKNILDAEPAHVHLWEVKIR